VGHILEVKISADQADVAATDLTTAAPSCSPGR
jgi:hypothetical protein